MFIHDKTTVLNIPDDEKKEKFLSICLRNQRTIGFLTNFRRPVNPQKTEMEKIPYAVSIPILGLPNPHAS